jgi:5-methylcytosine-specific restriction endonuclease McrA
MPYKNPEDRRAYAAQYYSERRDETIARVAAYRASHREETLERQAAYRATHRKDLAAKQAARYRLAHPERRISREESIKNRQQYHAAYRAAHRELLAEKQRAYMAAHPDVWRAAYRNRRARERGASGSHTAADVAAQRARQKGCCYWCGERVGRHYHVDHVVPLALGGSNGPENLVIACPHCNTSKGAKHPMEWAGVLC